MKTAHAMCSMRYQHSSSSLVFVPYLIPHTYFAIPGSTSSFEARSGVGQLLGHHQQQERHQRRVPIYGLECSHHDNQIVRFPKIIRGLFLTLGPRSKKNKIQSLGLGKPLLEALMPIITEPEGDDEDDETPSKVNKPISRHGW
jgi:hypothetical protein